MAKDRVALQTSIRIACLRCFRNSETGPQTFEFDPDGTKMTVAFAFPEGWKVVRQSDGSDEALCDKCLGVPKLVTPDIEVNEPPKDQLKSVKKKTA